MPDCHSVRAYLDDRHLKLAATVEHFAEKFLAPLPVPADDAEARLQARVIVAELGREGLVGWAVPIGHGGRPSAPDLRACCLIREGLAAASPLADAVFALQCLGSLPLVLAGSEEQCRRFLPGVAAGEAMAAFAMTEAGAGSDVHGMETEARRDGDEWILNGRKTLISNAGLADFYVTFAVTDRGGKRPEISCFIVPGDLSGVEFEGAQVMSSPHPLGDMRFDACRLPSAALLGEVGGGFALGMKTLDRLRATVGAGACGLARRALDEALAHARRRQQFGRPLARFQLVQEKLARMAIELDAARQLVYRAAWEVDRGAEEVTIESAMAKAFATEAAQRIVDEAVQIVGGIGLLAGHPVDRLYRSVRALRIYEGTTEIQYLVIANRLLREPAD